MAGIEIASAYVALSVKAPGIKKDIENELDKVDADDAGEKIGDGLGKGITNRQAALAGAVGGVFASIANEAVSALTDLVGEAIAASDATDKFKQTLDFAGLDTSAIDKAMTKSRAYADATVYDLSTIQNTTAQLAANGIDNYSELTEAAGNLNAVAGGNADTFSSVAMMLTQTAGAGKLTTENWNQLADAIPGASGRLQDAMKEAGAYTGNFRKAMEEGEITADEFNAALLELGTEPVAVEAATSVSTMEGAVGNLQAAIVGGLSDAFTAIKPTLTDIISGAADFVGFIQDNISWIGPLAAGVGIVAGAVAAWTIAQWALNAALTANPIGFIIVGIGLLVGALILLVQNWDAVWAWISTTWEGFMAWLTTAMEGFVTWWNELWGAVGAWITSVWEGFIGWLTDTWSGFVSWLTGIGDGIAAWWNGLWSGIGTFIQDTWTGFTQWVTDKFNAFLLGVKTIGDSISRWWNGLWSGIGSFFEDIFDGFSGFAKSAFESVLSVIRAPINGIIGLVNSAIRKLNGLSVTIPDWVPFVGGQTWGLNLPTIPMLASGGIITGSSAGTLAMIGEGGPGRDEAVIPLPDGWRQNGIGGASEISDAAMDRLGARVAGAILGLQSAAGQAAVRAAASGAR